MIFAQLRNNIIENTIMLDDASSASLFMNDFYGNPYDSIIQIDNIIPQPGIGWYFDNVNWIPPPATPDPIYVPTAVEKYTAILQSAMSFGKQLTIQFAVANILAGITQADKTQAMIDYAANLYICLSTGSLYAAIDEINHMIADTSDAKNNLSPFITNDILTSYKNQLQNYLGIPNT